MSEELIVHKETTNGVNTFEDKMRQVKQNILSEASVEDKKFVNVVKENIKEAAVKHTEVEQKKADFEKQKVQYESEKLQTQQKANKLQATEDKWANKEKCRQYHFNGVKPIMQFIGIQEPMNLFFLYLFTFLILPFFFLSKFLRGTIGALISGACDSDRPKAVKGFLWTLIAVIAVLLIVIGIYFFLKWQGIDILKYFF